jgi:hypothetical protein
MRVDVDQSGHDPCTLGVEHLSPLTVESRTDFDDPAVFDQALDLPDGGIGIARRIDDPTVSNQQA